MDEMTFTLNSPITEEQWDTITDVDFEHTNEITFHTKHDKTVKFVKASAEPQIIHCKDCQYWDKYSDYATLGTCNIWQTNRTRNDYCSEARCKDG